MEAIMAEQSSIHPYLNWTKQRIDEMDATLASLEAQAGKAKAESKVKADQMNADAAEAEARLQKLKQAGSESWAGLSAALAESRKAFDGANQKTGDALKGAARSDTA